MNPVNHSDSNIPLLTEVIVIEAISEPVDFNNTVISPNSQENEQSWENLEKTLNENILRQLLVRADFVLEHRVRDGLADVLQTAVESLTKDIRAGLSKSLEEIIQRTISQEISKIQSSNNKN